MIISPLKYDRDIVAVQTSDPSRLNQELRFMLETTYCHLKTKQAPVLAHLVRLDPEFATHLKEAKILKVTSTEHRTPNTEVTLDLGDKHLIRGQFTVRYDRDTLDNYFGIHAIVNENKKDPLLTMDEDKWITLVSDKAAFRNHINQVLAYKFGNTFGVNGTIIIDEGKHNETPYEGHHGLVLIFPSLADIEEGWKQMSNIENVEAGTLRYQTLTFTVRLVAKNHLTIQDGQALLHMRLTRPLETYTKMTGGKA